ncbi:MAG: hypothetical protein KAI07_00390, partial [Deltaproteobacteria bacterium]|nr:hypothetical protein [Deltaproteobacteria bacterium]
SILSVAGLGNLLCTITVNFCCSTGIVPHFLSLLGSCDSWGFPTVLGVGGNVGTKRVCRLGVDNSNKHRVSDYRI